MEDDDIVLLIPVKVIKQRPSPYQIEDEYVLSHTNHSIPSLAKIKEGREGGRECFK